MARLLGPSQGTRLAYKVSGTDLRDRVGLYATIYSDAAATVLANIATYDGTGIPGAVIADSKVLINANSEVGLFWFPDGADTTYMKIGTSTTIFKLTTDTSTVSSQINAFGTPAAGTMTALRAGYSTTVMAVGDSTSDIQTEWFGVLGGLLAARYPGHSVIWRPWNATDQWFDPPTFIQTGPLGERYALFALGALEYPAANITGDIEIRMKVAATDWTPAAVSTLVEKWASTANQRSFRLDLNAAGTLAFTWSPDGTGAATIVATSTVATGFTDGAAQWIRVTLDVNDGAGGRDTKFYTSTDGITWVQLGATVHSAATTSIFASTAPYQLGSNDITFTQPFAGKIFWVECRDGLGAHSLVPPMPEDWDQESGSTDTVTFAGSPSLLLVSASEGGRDVDYWNDATRRVRAFSDQGQDVILLSTNHNEGRHAGGGTAGYWITKYSDWVTNIKALQPGKPLVPLTQNPEQAPTNTTGIQATSRRAVELMTWAASQTGVYGLDTRPAFTSMATQMADGVHPNAAGSLVWANLVNNTIFPA